MTQYLLSVYQPDGEPPPDLDLERIMRDVAAWQQDLKAAGAWVFTARLHPPGTATVARPGEREVVTTDGPYVEGKEHIGGFTIIDVPDLDVALDWAAKFIRVAPLPVEVRPLHDGSPG
jgi:hypothetical protein